MTGSYEIGTYQTEGCFIQCIDPAILTHPSLPPNWAFTTSILQELGAAFFSTLSKEDCKWLPSVKKSNMFPYHGLGGEF